MVNGGLLRAYTEANGLVDPSPYTLQAVSFWSQFPFVRLALALAGGVLAAHYWDGPVWYAGVCLGWLLPVCLLVLRLTDQAASRTWRPLLGLLALSGVFLLGSLLYWMNDARRSSSHLVHLTEPVEAYKATALEDSCVRGQHAGVTVAISWVRVQGVWRPIQGKVSLSFCRPTAPQVHYGDVMLVVGSPQRLNSAKNPHEFDFAAWFGLSQVYHQHFVAEDGVALLGRQPPHFVKAWSFLVLRYCRSLLSQGIRGPDERAVVMALVLGQKDGLVASVKAAYAETGTMHVLAVSGLHVGMLYWLVSVLLTLLNPLGRVQYWLSPLLTLGILWFYAFVTGLSPSVLRATLMFTLVALAPLLDRSSNIYNTLAASAFLLLCWNPYWLFTVSFQLSYLAVLGIVYMQPRLYACWSFRNWLLSKLWALTSVSLAAQLATVFVCIYYFHQFSVYFVLANWVVVPAALFILCLGLGVLATGFWPWLSQSLAWLLEHLVGCVNFFLRGVQQLPCSVVDGLVLSTFAVILLYVFLILWLLFWHTRRLGYGVVASLLVLFLGLRSIDACVAQQAQRRVIFYSIDHHKVVAFIRGRKSVLYVDDSFEKAPEKYTYYVKPSHMAWGIASTACYSLSEVSQRKDLPLLTWQGMKLAVWCGKQFIVLDKDCAHLPSFTSQIRTDFLVVDGYEVDTLQSLLDRFDFDTLIIGSSTTKRLDSKLKAASAQCGVHSHSLRQQGALSIACL